jgi:heptosyltransferase I
VTRWPGMLKPQIRRLRGLAVDVAIDMQSLVKSAFIARLSGAGIRWGFERAEMREPAGRVFLNRSAGSLPREHVIRKNMSLAGAAMGFDALLSPIEFPIAVSDEHRREAYELLANTGTNFALLNPAGGWQTKLWPAENFGRLADLVRSRLGVEPVIVTAPGEVQLAERAAASARLGVTLVQPSLKVFYELARKARIYVGGDTGPTHLAVAAGAPMVGLFGQTEWWRNGSIDPRDICVERKDISCRTDCHRRECANWICMDINVESVFSAISRRLAAVGHLMGVK